MLAIALVLAIVWITVLIKEKEEWIRGYWEESAETCHSRNRAEIWTDHLNYKIEGYESTFKKLRRGSLGELPHRLHIPLATKKIYWNEEEALADKSRITALPQVQACLILGFTLRLNAEPYNGYCSNRPYDGVAWTWEVYNSQSTCLPF